MPALSPWASNAILFGNPSVLVLDLCLERFCFVLFGERGFFCVVTEHETPFRPAESLLLARKTQADRAEAAGFGRRLPRHLGPGP